MRLRKERITVLKREILSFKNNEIKDHTKPVTTKAIKRKKRKQQKCGRTKIFEKAQKIKELHFLDPDNLI